MDMEDPSISVVTRCTLVLGLPILLSHKQKSGECSHLQSHILDTIYMGQILVTHGHDKEEKEAQALGLAGRKAGRQTQGITEPH